MRTLYSEHGFVRLAATGTVSQHVLGFHLENPYSVIVPLYFYSIGDLAMAFA